MAEIVKPSTLPEWASDPAVGAILTPPLEDRESGWQGINQKPPYQWFNWYQELAYRWLEHIENALERTFSAKPFAELTISSGSITPTNPMILLRGEGAAADDLETIVQDELNTGRVVTLVRGNAFEDITVKHGVGNIELTDQADFILDSELKSLTLYRVGSVWRQQSLVRPAVTELLTVDQIADDITVIAGTTLTYPSIIIPNTRTVTVQGTLVTGNSEVQTGGNLIVETGGLLVSQF